MSEKETSKKIKSNVVKGYQIANNFFQDKLKKIKIGSCFFIKSKNYTFTYDDQEKLLTGIYDEKMSSLFVKDSENNKKIVSLLKENTVLKDMKKEANLKVVSIENQKVDYEIECKDKKEKVKCYKVLTSIIK